MHYAFSVSKKKNILLSLTVKYGMTSKAYFHLWLFLNCKDYWQPGNIKLSKEAGQYPFPKTNQPTQVTAISQLSSGSSLMILPCQHIIAYLRNDNLQISGQVKPPAQLYEVLNASQ